VFCFSGDHCGLCEVGQLFTKMGKSGCQHCKPESVYIPETNYYYPNFRKQARFCADKQSIMANLELLYKTALEERSSVRQHLSKESGYTGLYLT